ncbi:MAG: NUDIX hydrolase [Bacteroidetes bacterium]|nr:NUDIX hydrolase [Bacteroidota bacterium]
MKSHDDQSSSPFGASTDLAGASTDLAGASTDLAGASTNPWKTLSASEVYDNPWIRLTEYQVLNPSGKPGIYGKVHFKNLAIGIVAIDDEGCMGLVGQYRYTIDCYSWEIPEGGGKLDTDPLHSAQRELLEETGLKAGHWEVLLRMHLSNSVTDEYCIVFLATDLQQFAAEPEETEQLRYVMLPLSEVWLRVKSGEITDAITVAAVQAMMLRKAGL